MLVHLHSQEHGKSTFFLNCPSSLETENKDSNQANSFCLLSFGTKFSHQQMNHHKARQGHFKPHNPLKYLSPTIQLE